MLKTILLTIATAVAAVLLYAATRPDSFSLQRSTTISAPPETIHAQINDVKAFNTWNPLAMKDPAIKLRYEGAPSGPGAADAWESETVGTGRMEIIESTAPRPR